MDLLQIIAENKISEAIESGEFDHLTCAGRKIDLSDYFSMPPERRAAYQLLKNANILPSELSLINEINKLKVQYRRTETGQIREDLQKKIHFKETELRIILERQRK